MVNTSVTIASRLAGSMVAAVLRCHSFVAGRQAGIDQTSSIVEGEENQLLRVLIEEHCETVAVMVTHLSWCLSAVVSATREIKLCLLWSPALAPPAPTGGVTNAY